MRILLIRIHYPPMLGMSSRAMAELSKALVANGHAVDVLTTEPVSGHPVYNFEIGWMRHVPAQVNVHRVAMGPLNRIAARMLDPGRGRVRHGEYFAAAGSKVRQRAGLSRRLAAGLYSAR